MGSLIYDIPMVVFALTARLTGGVMNLQDPNVVRRPGEFWGPVRMFDDAEWTPAGLIVRRRFLRSMALSLVLAVAAGVVVLVIAGPWARPCCLMSQSSIKHPFNTAPRPPVSMRALGALCDST